MSVQLAQHYRFTVDQYQRLAAEGFIAPDARVELIDGEIIEMSPIGSRHNTVVDRLARFFFTCLAEREAIIRVQGSIRLNDALAPQPDIALLQPREDGYETALPTPAEVLLLVEVSDTSLSYDRHTKVARYAQNGIGEYWLVDLVQNQTVVHRSASPLGYRAVESKRQHESWTALALPGLLISGKDIFG